MKPDESKAVADETIAEARKLGINTGGDAKDEKSTVKKDESADDESADDEDTEESDESDEEVEIEGDESEDDEDGEDEDEAEESDEDDEDKPKARRPRKYIPKDDYDRRKKKWDDERSLLMTQLEEAKKGKKTIEAREDLKRKLKQADPDLNLSNIEMIIDGIMEEVRETVGAIPSELQEKLKAVDEFMENSKGEAERAKKVVRDKTVFESGWDDIQPELERSFPKMTDDERAEAKKLLGKVWRTKEFHKADVYRVFTKNMGKFEEIMSPHEPGLENGRPQGQSEKSSRKIKLSSNPSANEIINAEKRLNEAVGTEEQFTVLDDQL